MDYSPKRTPSFSRDPVGNLLEPRKKKKRLLKVKSIITIIMIILWIVSISLFGESVAILQHIAQYCSSVTIILGLVGSAHLLYAVLVGVSAVNLILKQPNPNFFFFMSRNSPRAKIRYNAIQNPNIISENGDFELTNSMQDIPEEPSRKSWGRCCGHVLLSVAVFISVIVVVGNIVLFALMYPRSYLTDLPTTVSHSNLNSTVQVEYTDDGMIHITANTLDDAHFAQGMVTAQVRLWQMEFQRRVASGTLSELVGDAALDDDIMMRTYGFRDAAKRAFEVLSPESKSALHSFSNGVNAYIDTNPTLPIEFLALGANFPKWEPPDSIMWFKIMSLDLSGNMDMELQRFKLMTEHNISFDRVNELLPKFDVENFPTILSAEDVEASGMQCNDTSAYEQFCTPTIERTFMESLRNKTKQSKNHPNHPSALTRIVRKWSSSIGGRGGLAASNNWVVHGNRTLGRKPLLCNDPHLSLLAPSIWILFHLSVAHTTSGPIDMIGTTFVGAPGIVLGRNQHIAWAVTNTGADVQDLFVVKEENLDVLNLTINSNIERFQISGKGHQFRTIRNISGYGPIISDNGVHKLQHTVVLKWVSIDPEIDDTTFDAFLKLNIAKDYTDFRNALKRYVAPAQNFIFASSTGEIAYQMPGKIPVRQPNLTGQFPTLLDDRDPWPSYIDFDDMPHTLNPSKGFIATANNQVVPECYPVHVSCDWDEGSDGYRARRISDMIVDHGHNHTVATMIEIQQDYKSNLFEDLSGVVESICAEPGANSQVCFVLKSWDGLASVGSVGSTVFQKLYLELMKQPLNEVGKKHTHWANPIYIRNTFESAFNGTTNNEIRQFGVAATHIVAADLDLQNIPKWGIDVHQALFVHEILNASTFKCLGNRQIAHGGDDYTVNVGHYDYNDDEMTQGAGPSYRQIVDFSELENSLFLNPLGQFGMELSDHYDDLLPKWAQGDYMPMQTNRSNFGPRIEHAFTVNPN